MKFLSSKVHTIIGLIVGVALVFAPQLFYFSENATASTVALCVGIFIILNELITTSQLSPIKLVPMKVHIMLDCLTGLFLALSPWLFGFADKATNVWLPHILVGILVVGYALLTDPETKSTESIAE